MGTKVKLQICRHNKCNSYYCEKYLIKIIQFSILKVFRLIISNYSMIKDVFILDSKTGLTYNY